MKTQIKVGYFLASILALWSLVSFDMEFFIYAVTSFVLVYILQRLDKKFNFNGTVLWLFDIWLLSHILGGLLVVGNGVLYSLVLIDIVGEPYSILKYDQIVHAFCYFVMALIFWKIVSSISKENISFKVLAFVTVLTATGVGGINEIVEFFAVVTVPNTNVGGYENTAIDIVTNMIGALIAIPFFKKLS